MHRSGSTALMADDTYTALKRRMSLSSHHRLIDHRRIDASVSSLSHVNSCTRIV